MREEAQHLKQELDDYHAQQQAKTKTEAEAETNTGDEDIPF